MWSLLNYIVLKRHYTPIFTFSDWVVSSTTYRSWKSITQSLYIELSSSKFVWDECGFFLFFCLQGEVCPQEQLSPLQIIMTGAPAVEQRVRRLLWRDLGCRFNHRPSSGLKILRCHCCSIGHNCGLNLIPGLGTPSAMGQPKKKKKKKR